MPKPTAQQEMRTAQARVNVLERMIDTLMADHVNSLTVLNIISEANWMQDPSFEYPKFVCTSTVRHATALMAERRARLAEVV